MRAARLNEGGRRTTWKEERGMDEKVTDLIVLVNSSA